MSEAIPISTAGTFVLQTAGGATLARVIVNNAGGVAGSTIALYDATSATGTPIGTIHASAANTQGAYEYGIVLKNGLTVVNGATASDITVVLD